MSNMTPDEAEALFGRVSSWVSYLETNAKDFRNQGIPVAAREIEERVRDVSALLSLAREAYASLDPQPTEGGAPAMLVDADWLREKVAQDPDADAEALSPPPLQGGEWPDDATRRRVVIAVSKALKPHSVYMSYSTPICEAIADAILIASKVLAVSKEEPNA